jgi:hypothetical protein
MLGLVLPCMRYYRQSSTRLLRIPSNLAFGLGLGIGAGSGIRGRVQGSGLRVKGYKGEG